MNNKNHLDDNLNHNHPSTIFSNHHRLPPSQPVDSPGLIVTFLSGTAGGVAQVLVGHPFDTLKVRLQTQRATGEAGTMIYRGAIDCLMKTIRHETVAGLYKGVTSPILGIGFCNAILFTANGKITVAGAMAGAVMSVVNCPIELLKVRLQVQDPTRPRIYRNIFDCAQQMVRAGGITGLYRGYMTTLFRDVPSFAAYFGIYESLKRAFYNRPHDYHDKDYTSSLHPLQALLAGGIAGLAAWLPCYPQDVIKSRMQASSHYSSTLHCAKTLIIEGGWQSLFRGFAPTMARAFPANAATFLAYELVQATFQSSSSSSSSSKLNND